MSYDPHDDLPDAPPSLPGHDLTTHRHPRTATDPAECTFECSCGWAVDSIESAGGPVADLTGEWEDHLTAVQLGEVA